MDSLVNERGILWNGGHFIVERALSNVDKRRIFFSILYKRTGIVGRKQINSSPQNPTYAKTEISTKTTLLCIQTSVSALISEGNPEAVKPMESWHFVTVFFWNVRGILQFFPVVVYLPMRTLKKRCLKNCQLSSRLMPNVSLS